MPNQEDIASPHSLNVERKRDHKLRNDQFQKQQRCETMVYTDPKRYRTSKTRNNDNIKQIII